MQVCDYVVMAIKYLEVIYEHGPAVITCPIILSNHKVLINIKNYSGSILVV